MYGFVRKFELQRHSYLLIAGAVIAVAVLALLYLQYQSLRRAEAQTRATMKANLELRLVEISEDAKRGIYDQATHILHSFRQNRVRERNVPIIERIFTTLTARYPEVENFYVVFMDPGTARWDALKFRPAQPDQKGANNPAFGTMIKDPSSTAALKRAWETIEFRPQTTVHTAYDPKSSEDVPRQFFFHTVFENSTTKRNDERALVGLVAFEADPRKFPAGDFYPNLIAKHQNRSRSIDAFGGRTTYSIGFEKIPDAPGVIQTGYDKAERLFPGLVFSISTPDYPGSIAGSFYTSSMVLGLVAAILAMLGIYMTLRAAGSEMKIARMKADFLASISHELKTPITSIRAFGELIHSGRSKNIERIREYGKIITDESDRLTQLINNILDLSSLERGARKFRLRQRSIGTTVGEAIELFRHSPRSSGIEIDYVEQTPVVANYDHGAIKQALLNLLSNAAKYSDGDEATIKVTLDRDDRSALISVEDFGLGISPEDQREMFKPFHRSSRKKVQDHGGTGLGLAITREIIKAHNGTISVDSEIDRGTRITIRLPITAADEGETSEEIEAHGTRLSY